MSIAKTIVKNTSLAIISSMIEMGISFFVSITLTRGLGTEQYGLYSYTIWMLGLTAIAANIGLGEMAMRFIPEALGRKAPQEAAGYIKLSFSYRLVSSTIVCIGIMLSSGFWVQQSDNAGDHLVFILVAITIIPNTIQYLLITIFKGFQRFDYALYMSLAMYPLRLILVIVFMAVGFGIIEILILNMATVILGIFLGTFFLLRLVPFRVLVSRSALSRDMKKQAWKYAITTAGILALGFLVGNQAAVFFIGIYCPVDAVGFYNLATRIGVFFHIFPMAFAYVLLPIVAEKFGSGENETIKEVYSTSLRFLMPIVLPLAVGGIALAAPIVTFLYGPDYEQTIALLQVLLIFYSIGSLMDGGTSVIRGINQPGFLLMIRIICAAVNIGMSLWLIPKIGVIGATLAFGMTALIMFPSYSIFIYKKVGARFPVGDALKAVTASLIMGAVVYLVNIQISSSILSMAVGIPLGVIVYLVAIFALRYVRKEDLSIIRRVLNSLPAPLKRVSSAVTDFAEKFM